MKGRHVFTQCFQNDYLKQYIFSLIANVLFSFRRSQNELKKEKQEMEKLGNKLTALETESQELKSNLTVSQNECKTLKEEHQALLEWKKEKELLVNEAETVQKDLNDKINSLDRNLSSVNVANEELQVRFLYGALQWYKCNLLF